MHLTQQPPKGPQKEEGLLPGRKKKTMHPQNPARTPPTKAILLLVRPAARPRTVLRPRWMRARAAGRRRRRRKSSDEPVFSIMFINSFKLIVLISKSRHQFLSRGGLSSHMHKITAMRQVNIESLLGSEEGAPAQG